MSKKDTLEKFMCEELKAVSKEPEISAFKEDPDVVENFQLSTKNHVAYPVYPKVKEVVTNYYTDRGYKIEELCVFWVGRINFLAFEAGKENESLLIGVTRFENSNTIRVTVAVLKEE